VPPAAAPSPPSHIPDAPSTPEPVPAEMNRAAEPAPSVAVPVSPAPHRGAHTNGDGHHTKHITQRTPTPPGELSEMFSTLRELFVQDRSNASRPDATRCGVCYLTFPRDQLIYREVEGYYACADCAAALNGTHLPMLRRQRK